MLPLVSTEFLASMLDQSDPPTVLDVRWSLASPSGAALYADGHLPGAVFVDLDAELAGPPGPGGRHPLPDPATFEQALRSAGVRNDHPVVVYDDADGSVAARAWWLLRWAGHSSVAVLDGGYAAWRRERRPVDSVETVPLAGDFDVRPGNMPVLEADGAAERARAGVLLDARTPERYTGSSEPVDPRAGHVPGAVSAPVAGHTDQRQRWRTPAELAERFARLGVAAGTPVGAYCGSGVTACSVVLALEVAGFDQQAALYAGSWSDWVNDPERPAVTGDEPG